MSVWPLAAVYGSYLWMWRRECCGIFGFGVRNAFYESFMAFNVETPADTHTHPERRRERDEHKLTLRLAPPGADFMRHWRHTINASECPRRNGNGGQLVIKRWATWAVGKCLYLYGVKLDVESAHARETYIILA